MIMMIANLNIDLGKKTITDMMNEARFNFKFITFMITASLTNIGVYLFIVFEKQQYQFTINFITAAIDVIILSLYMAFLIFVLTQNYYLPSPMHTEFYLEKTGYFKTLVLFLQASKFILVIFGNLYWLAYFSFVKVPEEAKCSYVFMMF